VSGAILTVAIIVEVAWSQEAPSDRNASRPALSTTATTDEWCMPISQADAIARVRGTRPIPAAHKFRARLFGTDYWAVVETSPNGDVEVDGPGGGGGNGWAVYNVDAHTGDIKSVEAGPPRSAPADWNALPDRTSSC
jgi:hypothetical protein